MAFFTINSFVQQRMISFAYDPKNQELILSTSESMVGVESGKVWEAVVRVVHAFLGLCGQGRRREDVHV